MAKTRHQICSFCLRDASCDNRNGCLSKPQLNVGSGLMLKRECVNLDLKKYSHKDRTTDVIESLLDVDQLFAPETFDQVLAFHVLEHFRDDMISTILNKFKGIMAPNAKLVIECPDILGVYKLYWGRDKNITKLIAAIYGGEAKIYGNAGWHLSGWTADLMAKKMEDAGFRIIHKGIGLSHGMGARDFQVAGIKI